MRALLAARRGALGSILAASLFPVVTVVSVASPHARLATAPRLALVSNQTASAVASLSITGSFSPQSGTARRHYRATYIWRSSSQRMRLSNW